MENMSRNLRIHTKFHHGLNFSFNKEPADRTVSSSVHYCKEETQFQLPSSLRKLQEGFVTGSQ